MIYYSLIDDNGIVIQITKDQRDYFNAMKVKQKMWIGKHCFTRK